MDMQHQPHATHTKSVLIIEDDPLISYATSALIKARFPDVTICTADCGTKAINYINTQFFDLILLDLGLPDMDGQDIAQHAKNYQNSWCANSRIIVLSAHQEFAANCSMLKKLCDDFIVKPLTINLIDKIFAQTTKAVG